MGQTTLAIWGTSGHARVVSTAVRLNPRWRIVGYLDSVNGDRHGSTFCGCPVLGGMDALDGLRREGVRHVFLAFGANQPRLQLAQQLLAMGMEFPAVVHPSAVIADDAWIGAGVFVAPYAVINADAQVQDFCIINTAAIVEHEARVGRAVHVGPGACLTGGVRVDECAWIGARAVVRDGLHVGAHATVGMGAVVTRSVPSGTVVVGCPARPIGKVDA